MSTLKMQSIKKVFNTVTGVAFVVDLQDYINDETALKFIITADNKQLCHLDDLSLTLKEDFM